MILRWNDTTRLPVEIERLTPGAFAGRAAAEVLKSSARVGIQDVELGEVFSVVEDGADSLTLEGDLRPVRGIGRGMGSGALIVRGTAGPHLGAGMSGGTIDVQGDVGDWAGAEMRGGLLRVSGGAGRSLGASYPGSRLGMRDGVILIHGDAGDEAGRRMRRGLIAVGGAVGEAFGRGMIAGSLFAFGPVGRYAGAGMKRGTIAVLGGGGVELLPSFAATGRYRFPFLALYLERLAGWGMPVPREVLSAEFGRYNGDLADGGRGELLVWSGTTEG